MDMLGSTASVSHTNPVFQRTSHLTGPSATPASQLNPLMTLMLKPPLTASAASSSSVSALSAGRWLPVLRHGQPGSVNMMNPLRAPGHILESGYQCDVLDDGTSVRSRVTHVSQAVSQLQGTGTGNGSAIMPMRPMAGNPKQARTAAVVLTTARVPQQYIRRVSQGATLHSRVKRHSVTAHSPAPRPATAASLMSSPRQGRLAGNAAQQGFGADPPLPGLHSAVPPFMGETPAVRTPQDAGQAHSHRHKSRASATPRTDVAEFSPVVGISLHSAR